MSDDPRAIEVNTSLMRKLYGYLENNRYRLRIEFAAAFTTHQDHVNDGIVESIILINKDGTLTDSGQKYQQLAKAYRQNHPEDPGVI